MAMRKMPLGAEADSAVAIDGAPDGSEKGGTLVAESDESDETIVDAMKPVVALAADTTKSTSQGSIPKKIIQNFELNLRVKDIDVAGKQLAEMVKSADGYISHSEKSGGSGSPRSGSWVCRIPDTKSSAVATELAGLGEVIQQSMSANDVSEEFYDVEARLKNKRIEEERLVRHLRDSTGKLLDILAVERELSRVRSEIEQTQGRLNYLSNQTSLATIRVLLEEFVGQRPHTPVSLWSRMAMVFTESLGGIGEKATGIVLGAVAMIPWLGIFAALSGVIYGLLRMKKNQ
jgi:hypothetical protein